MSVHELVNIIIRANTKYARLLEKDIRFVYKIDGVHPHYHIYTILSIVNNIVTNAVEAIKVWEPLQLTLIKTIISLNFE